MEIRSILAAQYDIDVARGDIARAKKKPGRCRALSFGLTRPLTGLVQPDLLCRREPSNYSAATGILPILACHSFGPVWCTDTPVESTATVTGMSLTSNS
ncbi:hypothetical protein PFI31113_04788 [Pandoraea fibrosis]|uniref:Uncharacterized protein n=1 Tax=Pandoraea fibrosis TaxID=1891094 RepID=A0A5E4YY97_9BURK|nr:hypothetical protein PFI31113_04788 [Pandoraea fibrosis]